MRSASSASSAAIWRYTLDVMKTLLLIASLAIAAVAQDTKLPNDFTVSYDKFKDITTVTFNDGRTFAGYMIGGFDHPGEKMTGPVDDFYLMFRPVGRCSGFCFNDPELIFIIDGERVSIGMDRGLHDRAYYAISRPLLQRIASAKLVEFRVGYYEGRFHAKTFPKLRTLLEMSVVK